MCLAWVAVVVALVGPVPASAQMWGIEDVYEYNNCTGSGPPIRFYHLSDGCYPSSPVLSFRFEYKASTVTIYQCSDAQCGPCGPVATVNYGSCLNGKIYLAPVNQSSLINTFLDKPVTKRFAAANCTEADWTSLVDRACFANNAVGVYDEYSCAAGTLQRRSCSESGCSGCSGAYVTINDECLSAAGGNARERTYCLPPPPPPPPPAPATGTSTGSTSAGVPASASGLATTAGVLAAALVAMAW